MSSTTLTAVDAPAEFTYLEWRDHYKTERPFQALDIPDDAVDKRSGNVIFRQGHPETVHDIRGHEQEYTLDGHGEHHYSSNC